MESESLMEVPSQALSSGLRCCRSFLIYHLCYRVAYKIAFRYHLMRNCEIEYPQE